MHKSQMRFLTGIVVLILVVISTASALGSEIFPLEDISPGLQGIGKTVISGNTIEEFDVEVLGLVPQSPPLNNLILIKVSGPVMERSGGIAQGMSGTPVYVRGQLLGAIGYTFPHTDHRLGLVTPAVDMFKLYDDLPSAPLKLEPVVPVEALPVRTPLLVQGLNTRNTALLEKAFAHFGVQVMPALTIPTGNYTFSTNALEAGSMVGAQFLRGDFQVASFGTVTHVQEDGRFIAFGHPFTHLGKVDFFASDAYVHHTINNQEMPFKIASLGSLVGSIKQDRAVGLGGSLGLQPSYIPIYVKVKDKDQDRINDYYVETITDEDLMVPLVISSAYQGVDATLDRIGAGTSFVRLEFITGNLSQRMIRENLFYSDTDIAVWSLTDLLSGLELLVNNSLQGVELQRINVEIEVEQERKTATIEKAVPNKFNVRPGEHVDVEVTIRPYRMASETRFIRIQIPPDTVQGLLTVTVRAGGSDYYVAKPPVHLSILSQDEEGEEPIRSVVSGAETLEALVFEYMDRERNNEIVAEFYPFLEKQGPEEMIDEGGEGQGEPAFSYYGWADGTTEAQKVRLSTQFIMDGMASFDLNIY